MVWSALVAVALAPKVASNVVYSNAAGESIAMDIHYPAEWVAKPSPCVVVIHGGAWMGGKRQDMTPIAEQLARNGFVAANMSYRLAPKHKYPAMIDDSQTAVRYLRAHAVGLGIDPNRIGAIGASAGGHLSLLLGLADTFDVNAKEYKGFSSRVQCVVDLFGPTDLNSEDFPANLRGLLAPTVMGKPIEQAGPMMKAASPMTYVGDDAPPIFIFHGRSDTLVPIKQSLTLEEALKARRRVVESAYVDGVGHELPIENPAVRTALGGAISFLRRNL